MTTSDEMHTMAYSVLGHLKSDGYRMTPYTQGVFTGIAVGMHLATMFNVGASQEEVQEAMLESVKGFAEEGR